MKKVNVTVVSDTKTPKKKFFEALSDEAPRSRKERLAREALTTTDVIPIKKK